MDSQSADVEDSEPRKGWLQTLWGILNQDVKTLPWMGPPKANPADPEPPVPAIGPIAESSVDSAPRIVSEVDLQRVEEKRLRREVLDWRDEFHFRVTEAATQAASLLAFHVSAELERVNPIRSRLFPATTINSLENHIDSCVRLPMWSALQHEQALLTQKMQIWSPLHGDTVRIWALWPRLDWQSRLSIPFQPSKRDQILATLNHLILGEGGLAELYRKWANDFTREILEKRDADSSPV